MEMSKAVRGMNLSLLRKPTMLQKKIYCISFSLIISSHTERTCQKRLLFFGNYGIKPLSERFELISQSLHIISGFEKDIRGSGNKVPVALIGAQGFVSTKSFISLQLMAWSIKKLIENLRHFHTPALIF